MDNRVTFCGFWLFIQVTLTVISAVGAKDCRTCKPGYYASRQCTSHHDTVCKPCSSGTFSDRNNVFKTCNSCSKCDVGEFVLRECSKRSDTVCGLCSSATDHKSENFIRYCLQHQQDEPHLGQPEYSHNGIHIRNADSSSNPDSSHAIFEGSGETVIDAAGVGDRIEEGSGVVPVIDETIRNITSVILPEETETREKTTKAPGVILVGEGIKLDNDTATHKPDVVLTKTTTARSIVLDDNKGVGITDPHEAPIQNVDVYVEELQENTPHAGASKREPERSSGTSIGVVVTVGLVCALVFFVLGFLASRFWSGRRERTFNVMEAERLNGKPPLELSAIEYKPNDRNKGSFYDEIPANRSKQNGSTSETRLDAENGTDPVYTKPVKREHAQTTAASASAAVESEPRKEPKPEVRPASEIRYMDEVEDQETDNLLPTSGAGNDVSTSASPSSNVPTDRRKENGSRDEKTPMLSTESDAHS